MLKDADLLFAQYEIIKKITGTLTEAEAIELVGCSSTTFHRWRKRLKIRRFSGTFHPLYFRKDIELLIIHRKFGTLIKKLWKL